MFQFLQIVLDFLIGFFVVVETYTFTETRSLYFYPVAFCHSVQHLHLFFVEGFFFSFFVVACLLLWYISLETRTLVFPSDASIHMYNIILTLYLLDVAFAFSFSSFSSLMFFVSRVPFFFFHYQSHNISYS